MIVKEGKEITAVYFGRKAITAIYRGGVLLWEAINSCFGKGYWINAKMWNNKDGWRNK